VFLCCISDYVTPLGFVYPLMEKKGTVVQKKKFICWVQVTFLLQKFCKYNLV
jgi:hypothetical protein